MASTYSTNLALTLMGTGDQAGTWGDTTNTNLGTLLEQAISGYTTQAMSAATDVNLTSTGIPNGASGTARNMFIECTGAMTQANSLIVPANKKLYFVYNNTTGGFAVTVKVTGLTGVSVPNGKKMLLVSNGTDIVDAVTAFSALAVTSLTSSGTVTGASLSGPHNGTVGATTPAAGSFTSVTDSGLTSGRVPYASTGGLLADSSGMTYDGTNFTSQIKKYTEYTTTDSAVTTNKAIDLSTGNIFNFTLTGNTAFTITNPPASGVAFSFMVILKQDGTGSRTVTWPAAVKFPNATAPTLSTGASKTDILNFVTVDGGSNYFGALSLANM